MNIPAVVTSADLKHGARVLLRSSLNVPVVDGRVTSTFRIEQALRTIQHLVQRGARVTVISHLGREGQSLAPVHAELSKHIPASFIPEVTGDRVYAAVRDLEPGGVLLLENTRTDEREEEGTFEFAEELAYQQEVFVMDDFTSAHRAHASTTGLVGHLPSYIGIRFYEELTALLRITERTVDPAIAFVGGAKLETKLPLIESLLEKYEKVYVGGVTANVLLRARGCRIGQSTVDDVEVPQSIVESTNVVTPSTVVVERAGEALEVPVDDVEDGDTIVDVGERFIQSLSPVLDRARVVVWNGPLGWYEKGYIGSSVLLARQVGATDAYSFVGGGDTIAALESKKVFRDWTFVSTGGGAILSYIATGSLAVLDAFEKTL